ncbi:reverse transcriptase domain-containing protein [Candidatus Magnetobacterium casense]|uniref:reverse transcriptase domain-containing protein n=1 Tax=Candidatus Magnetobacterium casense TaxID=1455061 RepID=UPI000696BC8F|nr:reverse transcriptase domain-containing protein [Candidatus Magnetobacterium casensis]
MQTNNYWSSTPNANNTSNAWNANMNDGNVNSNNNVNNNNSVWPVRLGEWLEPLFSFENLYGCYLKCRRNKRNTINALRFEINAEERLFDLSEELTTMAYSPSRTVCFVLERPKMREVIASDFRDRIVHHALVERLEAIYEPVFIYDSYACRKHKGIHGAVQRVKSFIRKGSDNGKQKLYYLHMDIKNFFMTIEKGILYSLLQRKVRDETLLYLSSVVIQHNPTQNCLIKGNRRLLKHLPIHKSLFNAPDNRGLPVGNLTSQFFANVYLNELDQYVKHTLKCRYYVRYCDDFLILHTSKQWLDEVKEKIRMFIEGRLSLALNEKYNSVYPVINGINFLGYIIRREYTLVRRRVVNNLKTRLDDYEKQLLIEVNGMRRFIYAYDILESMRSVLASYFGHLKWADTYNLRSDILKRYSFLNEYFSFDNECIVPRYRFATHFKTSKMQYIYYSGMFRDSVLFFQVGCFYEFYEEPVSEIREVLNLTRMKENNKGVKYGFPMRHEGVFLRRLMQVRTRSVLIVKETGDYVSRIKERLPVCRIETM